MEYYIALLLFIIPGFIINRLKLKLSVFTEEKDQFKIILNALSINTVVLIINYYIMSVLPKWVGVDLSKDFTTIFSNLKYQNLVGYFWVTLVSSIFLWPIALLFECGFNKFINWIRSRLGLSEINSSSLVWDVLTQEKLNPKENEISKIIEITMDGIVVEKGFLDINNSSDGGRELIIHEIKEAENYKENYTELDSVYVDIEHKTIIKIYSFKKKEESDDKNSK